MFSFLCFMVKKLFKERKKQLTCTLTDWKRPFPARPFWRALHHMNSFEWNLFQVTYVCVVKFKKKKSIHSTLPHFDPPDRGCCQRKRRCETFEAQKLAFNSSSVDECLCWAPLSKKNMTTTYLIFSPALWISILPYFFSFQPSMRCSLWSSGLRSRHEAGAQKQAWRGELKLEWGKNSDQKTPQSKVFTGVDSTEAGLNTRTQKSPHGSRGELRNAEKQSRSHWEASVQAGLGGNHPTLELKCSCLPSNADYTNELCVQLWPLTSNNSGCCAS